METPIFLGSVTDLARYPVKSMLGEKVRQIEITSAGVAGDRVCALIDRQTSKVASAKLPHRWSKLLAFRAESCDRTDRRGLPLVAIDLPDGSRIMSDASDIDAVLSSAIGREVTLAFTRPAGLEIERARPDEVAEHGPDREVGFDVLPLGMAAPEGGFVDFAPLHFLTTASIERVAAAIARDDLGATRFRPNIVIGNEGEPPFAENQWVGGTMYIGADVTVRVVLPTPRCAVPTLAHGAELSSSAVTQIIGKLNKVPIMDMGNLACLGAYAEIIQAGRVRLGDAVRWTPAERRTEDHAAL